MGQIKYPLLILENADIMLFYSVGDLESFLEPWTFEDGDSVYDSQGNRINLIIHNKGEIGKERVVFKGVESSNQHTIDLKNSLILFLRYDQIEEDWLMKAKLNDLIEKAIESDANKHKGKFELIFEKLFMKSK